MNKNVNVECSSDVIKNPGDVTEDVGDEEMLVKGRPVTCQLPATINTFLLSNALFN